jgi:oxygen-independent coproporphyrinogen III oxidase
MPGIYLHIPFCRQACHYCDFHFSTQLKNKEPFLEALYKEIELRRDYFGGEDAVVSTVYFGGGTPSLLTGDEVKRIMESLHCVFNISPGAEITLEANPDDLTEEKVRELRATPVNRLSIGIQSFFDEDLRFMHRAHNAAQAIDSVKRVQDAGFGNITIDLIYGTPTLGNERWKKNLDTAFTLNVPHVSAYNLTVEDRTALAKMVREGQVKDVDDAQSAEQFRILVNEMKAHDFIHYEISNFCREGYYSRHNSSYWKGDKYLGLGPSAHSYNGETRQWNVSNNSIYIKALGEGRLEHEVEHLATDQKYNEYVLTTLRTMWGTSLDHISKEFGKEYLRHCLAEADEYFSSGMLVRRQEHLYLTEEGKLLADRVASDLFYIAENQL